MAILDKVEITITSGGRTLQEYDVAADEIADIQNNSSHKDSPHVVKYIEAIPGANFQITYTLKTKFSFGKGNYVRLATSIDGHYVTTPTITAQQYHEAGICTKVRIGASSGRGPQWQVSPFYWKDLVTSELHFTYQYLVSLLQRMKSQVPRPPR